MNIDLVALGVLTLVVGGGLLSLTRFLYPRLDLSEDGVASIRFLTALLVGILIFTGLGLVVLGLFV
ncbi:hypothetical protein ACLI4Z_03170 [Natrialbaceae archaeon A-arb3/5]